MEGMKLGLTVGSFYEEGIKRMVVQKPVIDLGSKVCPS
jgi:hypothetical protein